MNIRIYDHLWMNGRSSVVLRLRHIYSIEVYIKYEKPHTCRSYNSRASPSNHLLEYIMGRAASRDRDSPNMAQTLKSM